MRYQLLQKSSFTFAGLALIEMQKGILHSAPIPEGVPTVTF